MSNQLNETMTRGVMWTVASRFFVRGLYFVVIALLARLLFPEDFGVIAIALFFTNFALRIGLGFRFSVIQRRSITQSHLSTLFWSGILLAVVLWGFTAAASPLINLIPGFDRLGIVLIAVAATLVIDSFGSVPLGLLNRSLEFKKIAIAEIGGAFATGGVSILLAYLDFGVWALVWGSHVGSLITIGLIWSFCSWRPSFHFSVESFRELWGFGSVVTANSAVNYIGNEIDKLIIGAILGSGSLGLFSQASRLTQFPRLHVSQAVSSVTFPVFSGIQDQLPKLRYGYLKTLTYTSLISFPLLVGLTVTAPTFVGAVYGAKWAGMVLPIQILCIGGIATSVGTNVGPVAFSRGRADLLLKLNLFRSPIIIAVLIFGASIGLTGAAIAISAFSAIWVLFVQFFVNRLIGLKMRDFFRSLYPATLGSGVMALVILVVQRALVSPLAFSELAELISLVLVGVAAYFLTLKIARISELNEGRQLVESVLFRRA